MVNSLGLILLLSSMAIAPGGRCSKLERRDSNTDEANAYVDRIIRETIEEYADELDPYHPQPANFSFERKHLIVVIRGEASLYDMSISGLTTIHREGDCQRTTENGISKLTANLGMGVLEFDSKATLKFMGVGPTVEISGEIGYALIHFEASRDVGAGSSPTIDKLEIYDLKGIKIEVSTSPKLAIIDVIMSKIAEGVAKLMKSKIIKGVEVKLKESLQKKVTDHVFPID